MEIKFNFAHYKEHPTSDPTSEKNLKLQQRVWEAWEQFAIGMRFDPEEHWVDLLLGKQVTEDLCRAFLKQYVEGSSKERIVLGPQEKEDM
ncbi:hypothetical protein BGZ63DRAFT_458352 [Mariannaea sp. PMI_226]|nr:hypothetical protein BGZ63DRAFT_458352 [Mariannaea sp. PMI_226]